MLRVPPLTHREVWRTRSAAPWCSASCIAPSSGRKKGPGRPGPPVRMCSHAGAYSGRAGAVANAFARAPSASSRAGRSPAATSSGAAVGLSCCPIMPSPLPHFRDLLNRARAGLKEVQALARHADPATTWNLYVRANDADLSELAEGLGEVVREANTESALRPMAVGAEVFAEQEDRMVGAAGFEPAIGLRADDSETALERSTAIFGKDLEERSVEQRKAEVVCRKGNSEVSEHRISIIPERPSPGCEVVIRTWPLLPPDARQAILEIVRLNQRNLGHPTAL